MSFHWLQCLIFSPALTSLYMHFSLQSVRHLTISKILHRTLPEMYVINFSRYIILHCLEQQNLLRTNWITYITLTTTNQFSTPSFLFLKHYYCTIYPACTWAKAINNLQLFHFVENFTWLHTTSSSCSMLQNS